ncbi:MAG: hypothetical protein PVG39_31515 [Desulfobacteraceae bacterium]|jgi:hypothetical protein
MQIEENAEFINYTRHPVHYLSRKDHSVLVTFKPVGHNTRIKLNHETTKKVGIIEIGVTKSTAIEDAPPPQKEGVYYIVSLCTKRHFPDRRDIICPQEQVRRYGKVIGCLRFTDTFEEEVYLEAA